MNFIDEYISALLRFGRRFDIELLVNSNKVPLKYLTKNKYLYRVISDFSIFSTYIY